MAFMPEANMAAAAIKMTTSQKPSPAPRQNFLEASPIFCLLNNATIRPMAVPISMQTGTEKAFVGRTPTCLEARTSRASGIIGMMALIGLTLKFF